MLSKTKFLKITALMTLICFSVSVGPTAALTISEERDLGREFIKHARQAYLFVEDPFVNDYINRLGQRLVAAFPEQPFIFHFYVINNPVYNAFAAPGGYVFVHSGLISAMETEEELAGILSHEIAHVYCRHLSERIDQSKMLSLATLAGITAGIFLGSGALAIGSAAAGQAAGLAYSRQDERQADQVGVQYLAAAGYSARGLLTMLKKIKEKHWFSEQEMPTYLTTHPGTEERIIYIDTLLASDRYRPENQQQTAVNNEFSMARIIIAATCDDVDIALNQIKSRLERDQEDALAHFGYALALSRKARHQEAIAHLQMALQGKIFPSRIATALGVEYVLAGYYDKAMQLFETTTPPPYRDDRRQLYWAEAAEKTGQTEKSIALLEDLIDKKSDLPEAVYALGMVYGKNDRPDKAHYYLGLYYYDLHDQKNALFHLEKALELTSDPGERKNIQDLIQTTKKEGGRPLPQSTFSGHHFNRILN